MANQKANPVDIDPDGDVIFICTYTNHPNVTLRLRVSSKVVSLASPVLKAMLSPHFREGTTLATASYVEIELPEDDAETMKTLFFVMHSKNDYLRSEVDLNALVEIVDKYDCVTAVATAAYYWISNALEDSDEQCLRDLLFDAYALRQYELFPKIARTLVLDSTEPIRGKPGVLTDVYSGLEDQRVKALMTMSAAVQNHVLAASNLRKKYANGCLPSCHYQEFYALAVIRRLGELKLWPIAIPGTTSVRDMIGRMRNADFSDLTNSALPTCTGDTGGRGVAGTCVGTNFKARDYKIATYSSVVQDVEENIQGVCLRCLHEGSVFSGEDCWHYAPDHPFRNIWIPCKKKRRKHGSSIPETPGRP